MNIKKGFFALLASISTALTAQQTVPEWYIFNSAGGNSNYNFNGNPLSLPLPINNYTSSGTLIKSTNNKMLFAVHNGFLLDDYNDPLPDPYDTDPDGINGSNEQRMAYYEVLTNLSKYQKIQVHGFTECIPLPIPLGGGKVDCNRYYILSCGYGFSRNWEYSGNGGLNFNLESYEPYYAIANANAAHPHQQFFETLQWKTSTAIPQLRCTALPMLEMIPGMFTNNTNNQDAAIKSTSTFMAATKLRSDDSYFVFVFHNQKLYRYVISPGGITFANTVFTNTNAMVNNLIPSEMEVTELSNGDYRIAIPYMDGNNNNIIRVCEVYGSGINTGTLKSSPAPFDIVLTTGAQPQATLHGIEFSPLNNYLYFTHETNTFNPNPIEYYSFATGARSAISCAPANKANFAMGFIERNSEVNHDFLYFTSNNEFVRLTNPDVPSSSSWVVLMNSASGYLNDRGMLESYYNPSTNPGSMPYYTNTSYLLPDYADAHNYLSGFETGQCCLDYKANFDIKEPVTMPTGTYNITPPQVVNCTTATGSIIPVSFNTTTNSYANVTIPANTKVTLNNITMRFAPGTGIIVNSNVNAGQQGGKLYLGVFTTLTAYTDCDPAALWNGVTLNGLNGVLANTPQGSASNTQQAMISSNNTGQIDHALTAIKINNGAFAQFNGRLYNNVVAIDATPYTSSTNPAIDQSLFTGTTFKTESTFSVQPSYFANFVGRPATMRFVNCTFQNDYTAHNNTYDGIITNDAALSVLNSNLLRLKNGIYHTNSTGTTRKIVVNNTVFTDNYFGIWVGTSDYAVISNSVFNIVDNSTANPWPVGLLLDQSSKFTVYGNTFQNTSLTPVNNGTGTTGIYARNTNVNHIGDVNYIEKNTFRRLFFGVSNEGQNYSGNGSPANINGLRYYCNVFENSMYWYAFLVNGGNIDYHQGIANYAAQNQFGHSGTTDYFVTGTIVGQIDYRNSGVSPYVPNVIAPAGVVSLSTVANTNDCSQSAIGYGRLAASGNAAADYLAAIYSLENEMKDLDKGKPDELAGLKGECDRLKKELVTYFLNDSTGANLDSAQKYIGLFLDKENNPSQLVTFYLSVNNPAAAKQAYAQLAASGAGANTVSVYGILIELYGKNIREELLQNQALLARLQAIANDYSDEHARLMSRGLINQTNPTAYREQYTGVVPEDKRADASLASEPGLYKLSNYPNPFGGTTYITASIPDQVTEAKIKVTDVLGRNVSEYTLTKGNNTIEFNEEKAQGVLFYSLYVNGSRIETKIMIKNN